MMGDIELLSVVAKLAPEPHKPATVVLSGGRRVKVAYQNPNGKSNLAKLVREGKVDKKSVGWVWMDTYPGGPRIWLGKYQIREDKFTFVLPHEKLPCEEDRDEEQLIMRF